MPLFKLPPPPITEKADSPAYRDWFYKIQQFLGNVGNILFTALDFTGSNLTSIATRNHNDLQNIQGGTTTERYHLTSAQASAISGGALSRMALDGEQGEEGPMGPPGSSGVAGASGATGPAGSTLYVQGLDGETGEDGPQGFAGPMGFPGPTGATGSQGPQGQIGIGLDGSDGEDGISIPGIQGIPGTTGQAGATGPQGPIGFGMDGDTGEDGMMGPPGASGTGGGTGGDILRTQIFS